MIRWRVYHSTIYVLRLFDAVRLNKRYYNYRKKIKCHMTSIKILKGVFLEETLIRVNVLKVRLKIEAFLMAFQILEAWISLNWTMYPIGNNGNYLKIINYHKFLISNFLTRLITIVTGGQNMTFIIWPVNGNWQCRIIKW